MGRIADAIRSIPGVVLDPGWETRGTTWPDDDHIIGVFVHHTAGSVKGGAFASLKLCRDGRTGPSPVPGPLCNIHISRTGVITAVAGEKANHAGRGSSTVLAELRAKKAPSGDAGVRKLQDDESASGLTIGIEVEHSGDTQAEPWGAQVAALETTLVHLDAALGLEPAQNIGHREWTRRKVDPAYGAGLESMAWLRQQVFDRLHTPVPPPAVPHVPSPPTQKVNEHLPICGGTPFVTADQVIRYINSNREDGENGYTAKDVGTIVRAYEATARLAGIPLAVVTAQMIHESGFLTSEWSARPRRNPAGIGVTGNNRPGRRDDDPPNENLPEHHFWQWIESRPGREADRWESGVMFPQWAPDAVDAHVGRLAAYALPMGGTSPGQKRLIDIANSWRRIPSNVRGSARSLLELGDAYNGVLVPGWSTPGHDRNLTAAQALAEGKTYGHALARHINAMLAV